MADRRFLKEEEHFEQSLHRQGVLRIPVFCILSGKVDRPTEEEMGLPSP